VTLAPQNVHERCVFFGRKVCALHCNQAIVGLASRSLQPSRLTMWPAFSLRNSHWQSLCKMLGAGGPLMQGRALRYS
jgi:hypothetical protein